MKKILRFVFSSPFLRLFFTIYLKNITFCKHKIRKPCYLANVRQLFFLFAELKTREFYFPSSNTKFQNSDSDNTNPSAYSSIHLTPTFLAFILRYRVSLMITRRLYQEMTPGSTKDWPLKMVLLSQKNLSSSRSVIVFPLKVDIFYTFPQWETGLLWRQVRRSNLSSNVKFFKKLTNLSVASISFIFLVRTVSRIYVFFKTKQTSPHSTKKWSFPLRVSSVNVTKSAGNWRNLLTKFLMESFIFCLLLAWMACSEKNQAFSAKLYIFREIYFGSREHYFFADWLCYVITKIRKTSLQC